MSAGSCRFCHCTEDNACKLPTGDPCGWWDSTRTVCTAPGCIIAYFAQERRKSSDAAAKFRKRTPGQIHELMRQEKNAKQRAARAKRKQKRGAA
jgi:hypothetical protein